MKKLLVMLLVLLLLCGCASKIPLEKLEGRPMPACRRTIRKNCAIL